MINTNHFPSFFRGLCLSDCFFARLRLLLRLKLLTNSFEARYLSAKETMKDSLYFGGTSVSGHICFLIISSSISFKIKCFLALAMAILGCSMRGIFSQEGPERHDSSSHTGKNHEGARRGRQIYNRVQKLACPV